MGTLLSPVQPDAFSAAMGFIGVRTRKGGEPFLVSEYGPESYGPQGEATKWSWQKRECAREQRRVCCTDLTALC